MQRMWMTRVAAAPEDPRSFGERFAQYANEFVMLPGEPLTGLLPAFTAQDEETMRLAATADLDAAVPVPRDAP